MPTPLSGRPLPLSFTLIVAAASALAAAPSAHASWTAPLSIGPAPAGSQNGIVTRTGVTTTGRGTVAWNSGGEVYSRDFTVGGSLSGPMTVTRGSLATSVALDASGNIAVAGYTAGSPAVTWIAARTKNGGNYTFKTLASGPYVNTPAAFGLKAGFLAATTSSFVPTTTAQGVPTAQAVGVTPAAATRTLGKQLEQVETGDFAHGADGSNWAATSTGHAISTGRRETAKPKGGKRPSSVAALVRVGSEATRNSILGVERFGAGSVATAGSSILVGGLDVQQTSQLAERGVPVVATGEEGALEEVVELGGVPDRRALEVDVSARVGGGGVVTWLQQTSSRATSLLGQPKWAIVDEVGDVVARGSFSSARDARDLRVVRAGDKEIAVWIRGTGSKARWQSASIDDERVRLIKAPAGTPVGRVEGGLNTSQLSSNGRIVTLSFVDAASDSVRVAAQRVN